MKHPTLVPVALAAVVLAATVFAVAAPSEPRRLTFEERVAAQRAIEQVYWNHRIWPKENPGLKPPLEVVLTDAAIRARVEDVLRESNALEKYWHRPVTSAQLQAELNRMASQTHNPDILRELFAAMGNQPQLIAETLARQTLVDRLIRSWYANDERFHRDLKKRAEAAVAACRSVACMPSMGGDYRETTWKLKSKGAEEAVDEPRQDVFPLDSDEWKEQMERLANQFGNGPGSLPVRELSGLEETAETFVVTAVLSQGRDEVRTATVAWTKLPFDGWWETARGTLSSQVGDTSTMLTLPAVGSSGCVADSWAVNRAATPSGRSGHSAVWTGAEMIVWGGCTGGPCLNTGGRYDPATDTWLSTSTGDNVPAPRGGHTAVWTGTRMIVWGGGLNTGGRYDPATDTWTSTAMGAYVPTPRGGHTAVWTGTEMIVWGGYGLSDLNTGGRYDPAADRWTPTSTGANVPAGRSGHTAVWSGAEMIVWGGDYVVGQVGYTSNTGGRYDPASDTWTPTSMGTNVPSPRDAHTAIWTGTEMIVWGGLGAGNTGGRYNPSTDSWQPTSTGANAPEVRVHHAAVWTGTEMIIWGGVYANALNSGGRYNPATDLWTPTSTGANVPKGRYSPTAVWTGTEMIIWGGTDNTLMNTGGRYDPALDTWSPTLTRDGPSARYGHTAVWTGTAMIVWGGFDGAYLGTGGRYDSVTDTWVPITTGPAARYQHTVVWTGTEMIVWGGYNGTYLNSGGRYNPVTNVWSPTSTGANSPDARHRHTAVWTGTEMIVWGGYDAISALARNTGGRYNPVTNTWAPTSTGANVPMARYHHTAVWTGTEMIVWGGFSLDSPLNTGGRYRPSTDSWSPTSTGVNVPATRFLHTAVWTGTEMIVWGGYFGLFLVNTGGRYDPSTDTWSSTSTGANVPDPRSYHTAVWTGADMIIWGGSDGFPKNTGGRYEPATDTWSATSTGTSVPERRSSHTAVWTGSMMSVWGGTSQDYQGHGTALGDGGLYCACPGGTLYYLDADGDGYGVQPVMGISCDGSIPAGYAGALGDCNDANAAVHPGATEVCNGVDDDCDGFIDTGVAPPGVVTPVMIQDDDATLSWTLLAAAQRYDVVYGDLGLLHSSGGDFTVSTQGCVAHDTTSASAIFGTSPGIGEGFWFLVRGSNCGGTGTYDSGDPSQVGSCDAEIAASPGSCGWTPTCGDGICSPNEDCYYCPEDCCGGFCGDYVCDPNEDCSSCPWDCGSCFQAKGHDSTSGD